MSFLQYTKTRSLELAKYLETTAKSPLVFEGSHPLKHSSYNHIHLWKLEYLSDHFDWIDLDYRVDFVNYILEQWRRRLKGLTPYKDRGYRMYVYEDLAPTISVVAETDFGFPYSNGQPIFVNNIRDVLTLYTNRSWKENFLFLDWEISEKHLLDTIIKNKGSISKSTAEKLGLSVGKLRTIIINMGLDAKVNKIRKHFHRKPADFSNEYYSDNWHIFERLLPAHYR